MQTETPQMIAEGRLVAAARRGDLAAFNRLIAHHEQTAYCVAWWLIGAHTAAEATERAVLRASRAMGGYTGSSFRAWLLGHVLRACHEQYRAIAAEASPRPERPSVRSTIAEALHSLPEDQRTVIILGDIAGLDYAEIAEALGQGAGAISRCLAHARADLATILRYRGLVRAVGH